MRQWAWVGGLGRPPQVFACRNLLLPPTPIPAVLASHGRRRLYWANYGFLARLCGTAHALFPGHVMPVMAASVARGGVNAGFLLRVAKGPWWSRSGCFRGSGEAAAPVTARKFRVTGTWGASGRAALINPLGAARGSPNCVFQARARPGRKNRAAQSGPGTCEWGWGEQVPIPYPTRVF